MKSALALLLLAGALPAQELARVLRREPDESRDRETLIEALVRLDPGERPALLRLALGTGLDELLATSPSATWTVVPEALPGLAQDALARLSPRTVCTLLEAELLPVAPPAVRRAALRLLARVEAEPCAALAWRLFLALDGTVVAAPRAREEAHAALLAAFRADRAAAEAALAALDELDPAAGEVVLEALAHSGRAELASAIGVLARDPRGAWARAALEALAELEARRPDRLAGETRGAYEALTAGSEPRERAEVLVRLVRCEDPLLVPHLIELGQEKDPRTRRLARSALDELARSQPDPDPAAWSEWYARELRWRDTRLEAALEEFAGDDPALAVRALHECLRHPLFRREAAAGLAVRLVDARAEAALAAMPTLAAWGSLAALTGLELALEARSPEVRALAGETLALLAGA